MPAGLPVKNKEQMSFFQIFKFFSKDDVEDASGEGVKEIAAGVNQAIPVYGDKPGSK